MSTLYLAKVCTDELAQLSAEQVGTAIAIDPNELDDIARQLGLRLNAPTTAQFLGGVSDRLSDAALVAKLSEEFKLNQLGSLLSAERPDLDGADPTDLYFLPRAWFAATLLGTRSPHQARARRLVVELVSVHPDAGFPPEKEYEQRRFGLQLLVELDNIPREEQRIEAFFRDRVEDCEGVTNVTGDAEDVVPGVVWHCSRSACEELSFDAGYWDQHADAWWAQAKVSGIPLRDYLDGPSDNKPFARATYSLLFHPGWVVQPKSEPFNSTAFW
jgi:hypothetical protein